MACPDQAPPALTAAWQRETPGSPFAQECDVWIQGTRPLSITAQHQQARMRRACLDEVLAKVAADYFPHYALSAWVTDVEVLRDERY